METFRRSMACARNSAPFVVRQRQRDDIVVVARAERAEVGRGEAPEKDDENSAA